MVSALDSGASGPGSSPGQGHYVVFLWQNTLLSQCLSPPRCINGNLRIVGETYNKIAGECPQPRATETGISIGSYDPA